MWDLRKPSGWFFLLLGVILCLVGMMGPSHLAPLTEANVNLIVGICMLLFGGTLLWLSRRAA